MRVAIDASAIGSAPSGARTRMVQLLRAYAHLPRRHEVVVLATPASGLAAELEPCGIACAAVPTAPTPLQRYLRSRAHWRRLLDRVGADVLAAETLPLPRAVDRPLLLTVHDLRANALPRWSPRRQYLMRALPAALARVARVIAVSRFTAREIEQLGVAPERISIVGNAPDHGVARVEDVARIAQFRQRLGVPGPFVLALGHVEPRKNLALLVRAIARLRAWGIAQPALVLLGADRAGEARRLAVLARQLAVDLVHLGAVNDADRSLALTTAQVVAVPSWLEGFGIVPLEAMRVGTPVVCASAGALPEVVGDAAPLVDPNDVEGFARALSELLLDPAQHADRIERGRQRVALFTWERAARELLAAHDAVAGAG